MIEFSVPDESTGGCLWGKVYWVKLETKSEFGALSGYIMEMGGVS